MNYEWGIKRGAYAGLSSVILIPLLITLTIIYKNYPFNFAEKSLIELFNVAAFACGILFSLGFVYVARKHSNKFLEIMAYVGMVFQAIAGVLNAIRIWNESVNLQLINSVQFPFYALALFVTSFAIAQLFPYYGKITLRIRNLLWFAAFSFFLFLIYTNIIDPLLSLILGILIIFGFVAWVVQFFICIQLLFRASKS